MSRLAARYPLGASWSRGIGVWTVEVEGAVGVDGRVAEAGSSIIIYVDRRRGRARGFGGWRRDGGRGAGRARGEGIGGLEKPGEQGDRGDDYNGGRSSLCRLANGRVMGVLEFRGHHTYFGEMPRRQVLAQLPILAAMDPVVSWGYGVIQ